MAGPKKFIALSLLSVTSAVPLHAQSASLEADAKAFGARALVESIDISPSGNRLVMLSADAGRTSALQIVDLGSLRAHVIMHSYAKPEAFHWCEFAGNDQLVCKYGGNTRIDGILAGFSRLITVDVNGNSPKQLGQRASIYDATARQFDGSILDWLPDEQGAVLMSRQYVPEAGNAGTRIVRTEDGLGVDKVNVPSLHVDQVEPARKYATDYLSDGRGHVRLMETSMIDDTTKQQSAKETIFFRTKLSREWRQLGSHDQTDDSGIDPQAVDADTDTVYVTQRLNGRKALYRVALDGSGRETLVASNPSVDIDGVVRFGHGQRVIGYTYATDTRAVVYFDPDFGALHDRLTKAIPDHPQIDFLASSLDGNKLLLLAGGDTQPGTYYLFNRTSHSLNELALSRPDLEHHVLAKVRSIQYPAADGTSIPAYLTMPPGRPANNLPAIVLPHGGPSARDEGGFDWLAQFLAARGYAVIQPNYRGSDGYGEAWLAQNGFRSWRTSIADISAAARYLVSKGVADPARLAIVGWSYGGYAALQSVATEQTLYKAAVAIAPVTDLGLMKIESRDFTNSVQVERFIGTGPHIVEGSPLRQANKIKVPVLLFHGSLDTNVAIEQTEKMAAALRNAPTPAEYVRFDGLDHQLEDSDSRSQMLLKIGQFLDKAIGH